MLADGGAHIGVRHSLRLDGCTVQERPFGLEEGEIAHLECAAEGAVFQGCEQVVEFRK